MNAAEPRKIHALAQRTAAIRDEVPMNELTAFFGKAFETVMTAARAQNVQLAGPPFARYHGMPGQTVDVEAGFPVAGDFHGTPEVLADTLPDTEAFEAMHQGSYDGLSTTYEAIQQRMEAEGFTPSDTMWEFYLSDPGSEPDPTKWLTRVVWPVA